MYRHGYDDLIIGAKPIGVKSPSLFQTGKIFQSGEDPYLPLEDYIEPQIII